MKPWIFKEDPGEVSVEAQALTVWPTINWRDETPKERSLVRIEVTRCEDAAWALGWFSHETFRAGRTDEELLDSFERFVAKHAHYQDDPGAYKRPGYHCLMGAQDRWRWKEICRCATCIERDIVFIGH
jgi:hypothetical protein